MLDEIECLYEDKAVCPWCGHRNQDSWELVEGESDTACPECGREYTVLVEYKVEYTTMPQGGWDAYEEQP